MARSATRPTARGAQRGTRTAAGPRGEAQKSNTARPKHKPARARGKEATRGALIESAASLLAERGDVSVRTIAAHAGVNHGLVHHYFGTKAGLVAAVLDHLAQAQAESLTPVAGEDVVALAQASVTAAVADDRFFRVLARALLDGDVPAPMQTAFPVVRKLVEALQQRGVADAPRRIAEGLSAALGWMLFSPWIAAATGLSDSDQDGLLQQLVKSHTENLLGEQG